MHLKLIVIGSVIAGGFLFFATGAVFCTATLRVSRKLGPPPPAAKIVTIVASDKTSLSAWWLRAAQPNGNCVIVLHGIGDSRVGSAGFAPMFLNEGYSVLLPDSRAHGASGGQLVTYGLMEKYDVIGWADWMKKAGCQKLYALGESLGASILIQSAAVQPVFAAIVAECPYADLRQIAEYRIRQMLSLPLLGIPIAKAVVTSAVIYARCADGVKLDQVSPVRDIAHTSTPILLIHGLNDFRTPPSNSEKLAKANRANPLWLVPNGLHTGAATAAPDEFRMRVLAWFAKHS